jgi:cytochrome c oxidase subunit 2
MSFDNSLGTPVPAMKRLQRARRVRGLALAALALVGGIALAGAALAQGVVGEPHNWQLGMQAPATLVKERIHHFHDELLVIITLISLFVLGLLGYVIWRFDEKRHPVPTRTTHHTLIEVLWTVIPVLILVIIAIPSFKLMYYMDRTDKADMTVKVIGHQWYWAYEYPDQGGFTFDSNMIPEKEAHEKGLKPLLDVDNRLIVPTGTNIRVLIAGTDVMHSWFIPSFGVQMYAHPGHLNETWMHVTKEGVFYGQCNQICGINHAFMPIVVEAVSKEKFKTWVDEAKKKFAKADGTPVSVAAVAE